MNTQNCPCGSGYDFDACCNPILNDHAEAVTAEQLMRSRYTAFYRKQNSHILRSWHSTTRPLELNFDDHPVTWLGLEIQSTTRGGSTDVNGKVEFTTTYSENGFLCELHEISDFVKEEGLWYYVRGKCELKRIKPQRNQPCLCGSGLKYKRCCMK